MSTIYLWYATRGGGAVSLLDPLAGERASFRDSARPQGLG